MRLSKLGSLFFASYFLHFFAAADGSIQKNMQPAIAAEIVALSNDPTIIYQQGFPGTVTRTVSSADKIAFYYASLRVINPTSGKIEIGIECVDSTGKEVISRRSSYNVPDITISRYLDSSSGYIETSLSLNPAANALVAGQTMPLKNEEEYYVRLLANGKLVALTKFRYFIEQNSSRKMKK